MIFWVSVNCPTQEGFCELCHRIDEDSATCGYYVGIGGFLEKDKIPCGDLVEPQGYWRKDSSRAGGKIHPGGLDTAVICSV